MTDDTSTTPPPPPRRGPRRLTRSTHDRIVAGVAGGAGRHFDVDPVVFRIGFVVACFIGGAGLFAYAAAWLLVPEDDEGVPDRSDRLPDLRQRDALFWVGIGLLVVAGFALADEFGFWTTGWLTPLLLIGVGFALWRSGARDPERHETSEEVERADATAPPTEDAIGTPGNEPPTDAQGSLTAPLAVPDPGAAARDEGEHASDEQAPPPPVDRGLRRVRSPRPPGRRRDRSSLGRLTLGVVLIVSGVAAALDNTDALDVTVGEVLAVDLAIIGLGLVIGAWFGRSRGLMLLGILLTPLMLFANVVGDLPWAPGGGAGDRHIVVTELSMLQRTYELGAGQLRLDLSRLDLGGTEVDIDVRVGTGEVLILLPGSVGYDIAASVRIGQVDLPGGGHDRGFGATGTARARGDGTIHLDVTVAAGRASVETATIPAQGG